MSRRRRCKRKDDYGPGKCQICGDEAVPPTGARYCKKHLPEEQECVSCGALFPWKFRGPGGCPSCYYNLIMKIRKENPRYLGWQYMNFDNLRERAEEFNQFNKI